jgi:hypothetical protein
VSNRSAQVDYRAICAARRPVAATWDVFVREAFVYAWAEVYRQATSWVADIIEVSQGELTYLFDAAPTFTGAGEGDDRVVAVWGYSISTVEKRDSARQAGFIPRPSIWSNAAVTVATSSRTLPAGAST